MKNLFFKQKNKKHAIKKPTVTNDFIHRQGLLALLIAPLSALSLHLLRFPPWMLIFTVFIFCWRLQIYRGVWPFPSKLIRVVLVFTTLAAVFISYRQWYSLEPMVFLLMMAFLLKILEVRELRDAIVLVFVAYFVAASAFLFEQGIVISLLGLIVIALLTACLFILQASKTSFFSKRTIKQVGLLIAQAVPVMLLMFFLFPRIGALWSVPLQSDSAVTGVSDSMSPGDFSQLSQSRAVAFRVSFDNDQPPPAIERYWRGLVLTQFDGRRWQRTNQQRFDLFDSNAEIYQSTGDESLNYEITMEPTSKRWLYGIPLATVGETSLSNNPLARNPYNELVLKNPIAQRLRYRVESNLQYRVSESASILRESTMLPRDFNPQTIAQARVWWQETQNTQAYINRVLNFYTENFTYTLSPPLLGEHTADEFLFDSQSGFCEHFSSSFVVLMRAVGIPARVVVGYQGGEWNTEDNYLIVRQQEAHAWAEVWLEGQGWLRVDPTAAVAPNRIERNLAESLSAVDQLLVDRGVLPAFDWARQLSLRWDSLNYNWQRWVLSYDDQQQYNLLKSLLGQVTALRVALLLMIPAILCLCLFAFFLFKGSNKKESKELKLFRALQKKLRTKGVAYQEGETVSQLCQRACQQLPQSQTVLKNIDRQFEQLLYVNKADTDKKPHLNTISALLKKLA